ncbi:lipopolysaccharide kinase InaA family protein [Phycisphaerales bacterium AB-hyl4]|uniref:Lipopolysaccharide kinase InaA family protein n=1 Tax=Natronomicrosphaera hydrolytica TaxID=3242702 RepID=A0ABV4U2Q1_9BACT
MLIAAPQYRETLGEVGLRDDVAVREHFAQQPTFSEEPSVRIHVGTLGPDRPGAVRTFYKEYRFAKPSWRFWGRASKARREFRNLQTIIRLGVTCAEPVACGERRDVLGRLRLAFIVTRAVPDAPPMDQFLPTHCDDAGNPAHARLRRQIIDQLAEQVACIHRGGFAHNDLHWRNVLVRLEDDGQPRLVWIDCPRGGRFGLRWLGQRKMIKDLATLDRTAVTCCTLRERLRFARQYHRAAGVGMPLRDWVAAVEAYRLGRWRDAEAPITPDHPARARR